MSVSAPRLWRWEVVVFAPSRFVGRVSPSFGRATTGTLSRHHASINVDTDRQQPWALLDTQGWISKRADVPGHYLPTVETPGLFWSFPIDEQVHGIATLPRTDVLMDSVFGIDGLGGQADAEGLVRD